MKLGLTEKQYKEIISKLVEQSEAEPVSPEPESGTSSAQTGGKGYPEVGKWESGVTRGPGNQIGVTKWSDVVGSKLNRGKGNPLKEQNFKIPPINTKITSPRVGSDYFASVDSQNRRNADLYSKKFKKITKYTYKRENDNETLFVNLRKGEYNDAMLDLREFMFSGWGLFTQIAIGIVGSEVGAPIALGLVDGAIIVNDFYLLGEQGMGEDSLPPANLTNPWDRFSWAYSNNVDFQRVIEDILYISTAGAFKLAGGALKYISKLGGKGWIKWLSNLIEVAITKIKTMVQPLTKMTNKLGKLINSMLPFIGKVSDYFKKLSLSENVAVRTVSRIPMALYKSAIISSVFELGLRTTSLLLGEKTPIDVNNITPQNITEKKKEIEKIVNFDSVKKEVYSSRNKQEDAFYNTIITDYPKYSNLKRSDFQLTKEKKDGESVFMIKGVKYYIDRYFNITKI
jgi:hypothetical protein